MNPLTNRDLLFAQILPHLSDADLHQLSQVSWTIYDISKPVLDLRKEQWQQKKQRRLVTILKSRLHNVQTTAGKFKPGATGKTSAQFRISVCVAIKSCSWEMGSDNVAAWYLVRRFLIEPDIRIVHVAKKQWLVEWREYAADVWFRDNHKYVRCVVRPKTDTASCYKS